MNDCPYDPADYWYFYYLKEVIDQLNRSNL